MASSELSLRVTDAYRAQQLQLRDAAGAQLARDWQRINQAALEDALVAWVAGAAATMGAAQLQTARLSDAYLTAFAMSELGRAPARRPLDYAAYQQAPDGRSLNDWLASAAAAVRTGLAARRPLERALAIAGNTALRLAAMSFTFAGALALSDGMQTTAEVAGWRRATRAGACGACLGLADGTVHPVDEQLAVHPYDRCVAEPVMDGVVDRHPPATGQEIFDGLTPDEQDQTFHGRGGADKAQLIRAGRVSLADLVARQPMKSIPDGITERPLAALVQR